MLLSLDKTVREMKNLARVLLPESFPIRSPEQEDIISCLKQREVTIDGYEVILYFNNCSYGDITLETLQIFGKHFTYLPFYLICKCAYKFLGEKELGLVEVMSFGKKNELVDDMARKIYVWTVYYKDDKPIASPFAREIKHCSYDGLEFSQVEQNELMFF
jgi:hypothetical protein